MPTNDRIVAKMNAQRFPVLRQYIVPKCVNVHPLNLRKVHFIGQSLSHIGVFRNYGIQRLAQTSEAL